MPDGQHSPNSPLANPVERTERPSWSSSAALGVVFFVSLYWVVPSWANTYLASLEQNMFYPILRRLFGELIPWVQAIGAGVAVMCACRSLIIHRRWRKQMIDRCGSEASETA